jgi:hypothetical protein
MKLTAAFGVIFVWTNLAWAQSTEIDRLNRVVEEQGQQIEELKQRLAQMERFLVNVAAVSQPAAPAARVVPVSTAIVTSPAPEQAAAVATAPAQGAQSFQDLEKKVDTLSTNLAGFKFSGDFRLRADMQARSSNAVAGPLQNIRSRFRVRLNVDKDIDPKFRFHVQLSTGPFNNQTTNDQEFGAMAVKYPFALAEAFVDYHPNSKISLRGGRMEEVFADQTRFLWDDDVRFNGFQQSATVPLHSKFFKTIEFRSGEYFLSNPNVTVLAANSPFVVNDGFQPGQKVRDANLFNPGVIASGDLGSHWSQTAIADIQFFRNPNEIQFSSTAAGFPVVINNSIGFQLSGPITAVGNATTTPGGAIYSAARYQIARLDYRVTDRSFSIGRREMPMFLDFQVARNVGTHQLRDAMMVSANVGNVRKSGDMRFLYQFAIKDANSIVAQFTDDDLGTQSTTNIAVHAIRFDLGITRFLQWQNLLFLQKERRANDPAQLFFVPLQRGANMTYRYLGQLAFTF